MKQCINTRSYTLIEIVIAINILILGIVGISKIYRQQVMFSKSVAHLTKINACIKEAMTDLDLKKRPLNLDSLQFKGIPCTYKIRDVSFEGSPLQGIKQIIVTVESTDNSRQEFSYYVQTQ